MSRACAEVRLLRRARKALEKRTSLGLCSALHAVYRYGCSNDEERAYYALLSRIRRSISGYTFVDGWLHNVHGVPACLLTYENMREYRLRWVDALIEEYS